MDEEKNDESVINISNEVLENDVETSVHYEETREKFDTSDLENCSLRNPYHFCFSR